MKLAEIKESAQSLLDTLKRSGLIQVIDLQALKSLDVVCDSDVELLILYLFCASRSGHICIEKGDRFTPSIQRLWASDLSDKIDYDGVEDSLKLGFEKLKTNLPRHVILSGNKLYLEKNYFFEKEILDLALQWEKEEPSLKIEKIELPKNLLDRQKKALKIAFDSTLSFVVGGPGVGKTYTAAHLLKEFIKYHNKANVALVAPTGKAVANLQEGVLKLTQNLNQDLVNSYTLHKLFYYPIESYLEYDLMVVDESSMIDMRFMLNLLKYKKPGSRLIFLGDPNQLPPIESGFIFRDLLEHCANKEYLVECKRCEIESILEIARAVNEENASLVIEKLKSEKSLFDLDYTQKQSIYLKLKNYYQIDFKGLGFQQILAKFQKIKILSPMREGLFGIEAINSEIKSQLNSSIYPIMITSNDYELQLFNGDSGVVIDGYAVFPTRSVEQSYYFKSEGVRKIPLSLISSYQVSYVISVHKSQGSEYETVIIMLPSSSVVFGKEMLYTALTRTKKRVEIYADISTLQSLIKVQSQRHSGLKKNE